VVVSPSSCIVIKCVVSGGALRQMTITVTRTAEVQATARSVLPLAVGVGVYLLLLFVGNRLLGDPDTHWQITIGNWILAHGMVPKSDIYSFTMAGQSWISTQWLAQVAFALAHRVAGWTGPVVLAAGTIAATFALLAKFLSARLTPAGTVMIVVGAWVLTAAHLVARPHVLALPVLVMWVGGLIAAADRGEAPSPWLLPLMTLWANLHGGFVFGLALIAPIALDAVWRKDPAARKSLAWRWIGFACAALAASCITPYGWNALLASGKILSLGHAADQRMASGQFRPPRRFRNMPTGVAGARAVARRRAAAAADRAAARSSTHGVERRAKS
jgi:hypothetical protein